MLSLNKCKELENNGFGATSANWVICDRMDHSNIYYTVEDSPYYDLYPLEIIPHPSMEEIIDKLPETMENMNHYFSGELTITKTCVLYWNHPNTVVKKNLNNNEYYLSIDVKDNDIHQALANLWLLLKQEQLI